MLFAAPRWKAKTNAITFWELRKMSCANSWKPFARVTSIPISGTPRNFLRRRTTGSLSQIKSKRAGRPRAGDSLKWDPPRRPPKSAAAAVASAAARASEPQHLPSVAREIERRQQRQQKDLQYQTGPAQAE